MPLVKTGNWFGMVQMRRANPSTRAHPVTVTVTVTAAGTTCAPRRATLVLHAREPTWENGQDALPPPSPRFEPINSLRMHLVKGGAWRMQSTSSCTSLTTGTNGREKHIQTTPRYSVRCADLAYPAMHIRRLPSQLAGSSAQCVEFGSPAASACLLRGSVHVN